MGPLNSHETISYRVLKGGVLQLGNPEDSVWEDWGTLGNIGED